jgi:hypothetical protein
MNDFLGRLVERSLAGTAPVRPEAFTIFEPQAGNEGTFFQANERPVSLAVEDVEREPPERRGPSIRSREPVELAACSPAVSAESVRDPAPRFASRVAEFAARVGPAGTGDDEPGSTQPGQKNPSPHVRPSLVRENETSETLPSLPEVRAPVQVLARLANAVPFLEVRPAANGAQSHSDKAPALRNQTGAARSSDCREVIDPQIPNSVRPETERSLPEVRAPVQILAKTSNAAPFIEVPAAVKAAQTHSEKTAALRSPPPSGLVPVATEPAPGPKKIIALESAGRRQRAELVTARNSSAISPRPTPSGFNGPAQLSMSPPLPPTINVTIGRIEVRATPPPRAPAPPRRASAPIMSLDEYLRQRAGGNRR